MIPDAIPQNPTEIYLKVIIATGLIQVAIALVGVLKSWVDSRTNRADNQVIKQQNAIQIKKQDIAIGNQVELSKQLNGATEVRVIAATDAGLDKGRLEGAATEQARVAKIEDLKSHSGD